MQKAITLGELKDTYGLLMPECKKFSRRPDSTKYEMEKFVNQTIRNGDTIGVLLEFDAESGISSLSFFRNGGLLGKAFEDIQASEYFPCLSINYGRNITMLNSSARMPSYPYKQAVESADKEFEQKQEIREDDYGFEEEQEEGQEE